MYYEINVSKLNPHTGRYEHYFATAERSITNMFKLEKIANDFKIKFPTIEGFKIDCMHWEKVGEEIEI